jgi:hypothetical protein
MCCSKHIGFRQPIVSMLQTYSALDHATVAKCTACGIGKRMEQSYTEGADASDIMLHNALP